MAETNDEKIRLTQAEDFSTAYANNVQYETTVFDMSMVFGTVERDENGLYVEQHTSITMSWPQVKLAFLFFAINLMAFEERNGNVPIPLPVLPPFLKPEHANLRSDKILLHMIEIADKPAESKPEQPS